MKIRTDFVANSSSSSFLLAFKSRQDGIEQIANLYFEGKCSASAQAELLKDFMEASTISCEDVLTRYGRYLVFDARYVVDYSCGNGDFRRKWLADHPEADKEDYYKSTERAAKINDLVRQYTKSIDDKIAECGDYLVEVEYEDHTPHGSELEHDVLPRMPFTVRQFSHH